MADDRVVTELVIDSDTSGADRYSQAMDRASASSQSGIGSAQGVALAVAGVGTAFIAALAAARGFYDFVGQQNKQLIDIAENAANAGMSTREFQQTLFAARASGLTEKDFVSGLDRIGADLTEAGRGVTQFGKLFEANGISIRNSNGELKTTKEALADIAGLMQNATPQTAQAIARIAGLSKEWVPFLRQGVEAIEAQKRAASDLGIVIDDDVIQKAKEFDREWKTATAAWDLQFKAALADILPLLVQLAGFASTIIEGIGSVTSAVSRWTTPDESKSKKQLVDQIADVERLRDSMERLGDSASEFQKFKVTNLKEVLGLPGDADLARVDALLIKLTELHDKPGPKRIDITGGTTRLPSTGEDSNNALDTEIQRLEKHIALLQADTEAVGQSEAARAGLRAEAALYAAAERAGFTDLEQFADKFMKIREQVEGATRALIEAKVNSDIKFQRDTTFLSPQDVQIAQQLKGLYPDVATALGSVEATAIRVNNAVREMSDGFRDVGKSMFTAFLSGKNVMDAMVASLDNVSAKLANSAFDNILSGNPTQMAIGAVQAGASALISMFTGDQKAKKELEEAKAAWAKMADQVTAFNRAAAGFDIGPLTNELESLNATQGQLQAAALKAHDITGAQQVATNFNNAVMRIYEEFRNGPAVLTPLQQQMKALNDEAEGLKQALSDIGFGGLAENIDSVLAGRMRALLAQYRDTLTAGLTERINNASGQSYLNDANALLKQRQQDLSDAAILGNDPALLAQIAAAFHAAAQKIVEDAGLVGDEFNQFVALFPDFAGVVTQSATALEAANEKFAALTKTINDYLDSLQVGKNSILSPQDQLGAAQSQFNAQLKLAQGGDADALGSITRYASTLLDQAKGFYASSAGYTDIYGAVTAALRSLTGGGSAATAGISQDLMPQQALIGPAAGLSGSVTTPLSTSPRITASNDNGQYFASLGTQLVNAMAGVSMGEIAAMREENAALRAMVARLIKAVEDNRPRALRPSEKAA